jgi:hypothetical protein
MARQTIPIYDPAWDDTPTPATILALDGGEFAWAAGRRLVIQNPTEGPLVATVITPLILDGDLTTEDREVTVAAGDTFISPKFTKLLQTVYVADGKVSVDVDDDGLTMFALEA